MIGSGPIRGSMILFGGSDWLEVRVGWLRHRLIEFRSKCVGFEQNTAEHRSAISESDLVVRRTLFLFGVFELDIESRELHLLRAHAEIMINNKNREEANNQPGGWAVSADQKYGNTNGGYV